MWVGGVGDEDELRVGVVAQQADAFLGGFHVETFQVWIALVVGIIEGNRPYFLVIKFLYAENVVVVMVVGVEICQVILAVFQYNKDVVLVVKFAQIAPVLFIIDAIDVGIEPHLASAQCAMAATFQADAVDGELGYEVTLDERPLMTTSLKSFSRKILRSLGLGSRVILMTSASPLALAEK